MQRSLPLFLIAILAPSIAVGNAQPKADAEVTETILLTKIRASTAAQLLSLMKASSFPGLGIGLEPDRKVFLLVLSGSADEIARAKEVIRKLENPDDPMQHVGPTFRHHDIPAGNAEAMAKRLQETYKDQVRIMVSGPQRLFVWAEPKFHAEIANGLSKKGPPNNEAEPKKGAPLAKPKEPAALVGEPSLRIYPVPGGHAEAIAKVLREVYPPPLVRIAASGSNHLVV